MTRTPKIRAWKAIALLATVIALLLLLLPHATDSPTVNLFLLVPIFLFVALIDERCTCTPRKDSGFVLSHHVTTTLFQRPPPSQA
jgi:hypothetical protein